MELTQDVKYVIIAVVIFIAGLACGRFTTPSKVVTKTETVTVEKEVVKTKEKNVTDTNKNRELVVTETVKPDGTKIIEKHYINRDEIHSTSDKVNVATTESKTDTKSSTVTTNEKNDWNLSALVTSSHTDSDMFHESLSYGVHIQRRIIGPFSIGAFGITNKTYGLSIGASF